VRTSSRRAARLPMSASKGMKVDLQLEHLWSLNIAITTRLVDAVTTPLSLETVQAGKVDPTKLITHRFSLMRFSTPTRPSATRRPRARLRL